MDPRRVIEYGQVVTGAYPPQHPDHAPADADADSAAQSILEVLSGAAMGPWIAGASLHVADPTDRIVGQILVNLATPDAASVARPFVTERLRRSRHDRSRAGHRSAHCVCRPPG